MKRLVLVFFIAAHMDCSAQSKLPQRFAVTSAQVARALDKRGLTVSDDQISFPANIVTASVDPLLDIDSVEPMTDGAGDSHHRSKVKLVCHSPQLCVPFYVVVGRSLGSALPVFTTHNGIALAPAETLPISVRIGNRATLVVDTGQMHIELPVICLQNGAVGARIRVVSPDHKQSYTATVVSSTLVTGSL
jgi:hypothetical protein